MKLESTSTGHALRISCSRVRFHDVAELIYSLPLRGGKILLLSSLFPLPALSSLSCPCCSHLSSQQVIQLTKVAENWPRRKKKSVVTWTNKVSGQLTGSASAAERMQLHARNGGEEPGDRTTSFSIRKIARLASKVVDLLPGPGAYYNCKNQTLPLPVTLMPVFSRKACLDVWTRREMWCASARSLVWMLVETGLWGMLCEALASQQRHSLNVSAFTWAAGTYKGCQAV